MKKILLFCCLFLLVFSVSYGADLSTSVKEEIISKCEILKNKGAITQAQYDSVYNRFTGNYSYSNCSGGYAILIGKGSYYSGTSTVGHLSTTPLLYIVLQSGNYSKSYFYNQSNNISNTYYTRWLDIVSSLQFNSSGTVATPNNYFDDLTSDCYIYTTVDIKTRRFTIDAGEEYGGSYLNTRPIFTPIDYNGYVSVTSNGVTVAIPRLIFSYTGQSYFTLGYLSNYKDNNEFYNLDGNFGPYVTDDIIDGSMASFHFDYENGALNGSLAFNYDTGAISIKATKLIDLQTYNLYLQYSAFNGTYQDLGSFDYYATYYTTHVTSGELISPDLNSTVDIGFVNALDDFFDYDNVNSGDLDYMLNSNIFNFTTSGDLYSGDLFSGDIFNKLGFFGKSNNKYDLFIYRIYKNILNVLGSNTDYSITISYRNFSKTLHGSDFYVPSGPLKTFISLFLLGGIVILFYQQLHSIYIMLVTFDIFGFVKNTDHEHSFFM